MQRETHKWFSDSIDEWERWLQDMQAVFIKFPGNEVVTEMLHREADMLSQENNIRRYQTAMAKWYADACQWHEQTRLTVGKPKRKI